MGQANRLCVSEPTKQDMVEIDKILAPIPSDKIKIAIAPFSSTEFKNWDVYKYDEFMSRLSVKYHCQFFILGGGSDASKEFKISGGANGFTRKTASDRYSHPA